jgi:short-chain fatty acids transporter
MIARMGDRLTALFKKILPDPFIFALLLTILTFLLARIWTGTPLLEVALAWSYSPKWQDAFWSLLEFSMQMCLVLVTGHALAEAPPVKRLLRKIAEIPNSTASAAALVCFTGMTTALLNWGLGLIAGAVLARETAWAAKRRGLVFHYPILGAAGYMGLMNWHGGLSGSGPLDLASKGIPITQTILLPGNIVLNVLLLIATPAIYYFMAPRRPEDCEPITLPEAAPVPEPADKTLAWRLENSPTITLIFATLAAVVAWKGFQEKGFGFINLYAVPFLFLFFGMLLHWSPASYIAAVNEGARGCGGIILQFPFYAGISGIMVTTHLGDRIAEAFTGLANATTAVGIPAGSAFAMWTFIAGCLINMFIPSGGGQWKVQGAFAVKAGQALTPPVGIHQTCMFIAYGDELTNMLQPFWALPILAITGLRANRIMGYSAAAMILVFPIYLVCTGFMA